ncbi:hypothetical protein N7466_008236 [Penicillium verhagenii]|uniref:uncharacterized protein n=1 Tax=Penicillium verhagenii TaxID=1562060 RepID=UPI002545B376|nr:uncharacterized protein N7466_008236 [Penicillium verhagenii]KAJ5924049.1 hypothetical protein N7466_008236 [Penicillium verhagenii]
MASSRKRLRVSFSLPPEEDIPSPSLPSLQRTVSPPQSKRSKKPMAHGAAKNQTNAHHPSLISSPFELTHIKDLPDKEGLNDDTVKLRDILGHPLIKECWQFNYLFDVDFMMSNFDQDVRGLAQVKVVHGTWEEKSWNKMTIDESCSRYPNVKPITAILPEPFGTHHSKMMIIFRHDDLAQVVIHTANMIPQDWANMTQAVWRSPLLPLLGPGSTSSSREDTILGSGLRFKMDLLEYLRAYGLEKTGPLVQHLSRFDFSAVRAALIASVPSRQKLNGLDSNEATLWGWPALRDLTTQVRSKVAGQSHKDSQIAIQVSSIASLGKDDQWLKNFFKALAPRCNHPPNCSIIWPTMDEVADSLDGYASGGSLHMKTESAAHQKQLQYLLPHLCQWSGDSNVIHPSAGDDNPKRKAGRGRAAPHIKTYIRFSDASMNTIDWAMLTSANLSKQAWGAVQNDKGQVRISSFEIGVVVWPKLYIDSSSPLPTRTRKPPSVLMVPCFKRNQPEPSNLSPKITTVVGLRMPYDLPLTPYGTHDEPWSAIALHQAIGLMGF